jgi:hypothetical protein
VLELEKWGLSKPKNVVMLAHEAATGADATYEFLASFKDRRRPEGYFELPPVSKWLEFYSGKYTIVDYLISQWSKDEEQSGSAEPKCTPPCDFN